MVLKILSAILLLTVSCFANTCAGSFSSFLAPGFQCNIGSYVFSDFKYDSLLQGMTGNPAPENISVIPVNGGFRLVSPEFWVGNNPDEFSLNEQSLSFAFHVTGLSSLATLEWGGLTNSEGWDSWDWQGITENIDEAGVYQRLFFCPDCPPYELSITAAYPVENGLDVYLSLELLTFQHDFASMDFIGASFGVPEPASLILLGAGLLAAGASIRRFRR